MKICLTGEQMRRLVSLAELYCDRTNSRADLIERNQVPLVCCRTIQKEQLRNQGSNYEPLDSYRGIGFLGLSFISVIK